jgi:DNA modification methylase
MAFKRYAVSYEPFFMLSKNKDNNFIPVRDPNNVQQGIRTKRQKNGTITTTHPNPEGVKYTDVWNIPKLSGGAKKTKHKTEKPLELGRRMIKSVSECKLIYIPFAGSGSEIINCQEAQIPYIATEINSKYIEDIIYPRIQTGL